MAVLTAHFELGTSGNNILTSDTGDSSAWNARTVGGAGNSFTYDNAQFANEAQSAKLVLATSSDVHVGWTLASPTDHFGRFYLRLTAYPNAVVQAAILGAARAAAIRVNSTGKISLRDSANSEVGVSTSVIPTDTWVRIEYEFIHSTTVGQIIVRYYATADSSTITETIDSGATRNTNTAADGLNCGLPNGGAASTIWYDAVIAAATGWPGAYPVFSACTVSGAAAVGSTLTANPTLNGTFTLAYQWTRDGGNIGGATSSTYVTQAADIGHAVGCTVTATGQQATDESASQASSNTITVVSFVPRIVSYIG